MKHFILLTLTTVLTLPVCAQKDDTKKEKKTAKEVINELPEMLIAQPDAMADTNANKLINGDVAFVIPLLWKEKGLQTIIDYKLQKTDAEPLLATMPLPDKKLAQGVVITSGTIKKTTSEKKQLVLTQIKNHLSAFYKEAQVSITATELTEKVNAMQISSEPFTTDAGLNGNLCLLHDIDTKQSSLCILFLAPAADPAKTHFVQINYLRYNYETTYPEDPLEWKMFVYEDEQKAYVDFTKSMLKTLRIN